MKHIKKKFYLESKLNPLNLIDGAELLSVNRKDNSKIKEVKNGNNVTLVKTQDDVYRLALIYKYQGEHVFIPVPDLTLVYYNNAYSNNLSRKRIEKTLFKKLNNFENGFSENIDNEIYSYIGVASSSIIQMFTSLESFMNHIIPDNEFYKKVDSKKTELYNKDQIQKYISFDEKIKKVIPFFLNKDFYRKQTPTNSRISDLKKLRDEIVHTKSDYLSTNQSELLERLLKFNYDETLVSLRKYMNFYKDDYIIECDCSNNF